LKDGRTHLGYKAEHVVDLASELLLAAEVYANRRRTRRAKSKKLQRLRSARVERSFAHVCDSRGTPLRTT
jgi:hypothetical protein